MSVWKPLGSLLVAIGVALLAGLGWELWGTGLATEDAQRQAASDLTVAWQAPPVPGGPVMGEPIARLRIPSLGVDQVVLEGAGDQQLAAGPGHYPGTAMPGQPGNAAIAGHRVTHGAPFNRLDELQGCDEIDVDVRDTTYVYRVLSMAGESTCGLAAGVPGREIVDPSRGDVLNPVPGRTLLTLTTCHPKYSARQRLIVHAELVGSGPR